MRLVRSLPARGATAWDVPVTDVNDLAGRFPEAKLVRTTLARVPKLDPSRSPGVRVWVALESLQVTGSFKARGALVALAEARRAHGSEVKVVAASAGNHAAGVAYAARVLGVRATVVMPKGAPEAKRARVLAEGAEIVQVDSPHYDDAEAHALRLASESGRVFVSPYDDPFVAAGNGGSLGFEITSALGKAPDVVLCPFGGGGLASGLGWSFRSAHASAPWGLPEIWGVQSEASPAMALSLTRGSAVTRLEAGGETLAEGLEGGISRSGFERARAEVTGVLVVTEVEIAHAMAYAWRELGLVVEGSAAAALAPALVGLPAWEGAEEGLDVVVVLTGRNVDRERLLRVLSNGD